MASHSQINSLALLQQQQKTTDQLNSLLEKSAEAIMCGPTCQKMKKTQEAEFLVRCPGHLQLASASPHL